MTITHASTGLGTCPNCGGKEVERAPNEREGVLVCTGTVRRSDGKVDPCGARWSGVRERVGR
jgi:transcription initiation factor TFIIIB Brf1 subunit/transcription initiation factor TFIIB